MDPLLAHCKVGNHHILTQTSHTVYNGICHWVVTQELLFYHHFPRSLYNDTLRLVHHKVGNHHLLTHTSYTVYNGVLFLFSVFEQGPPQHKIHQQWTLVMYVMLMCVGLALPVAVLAHSKNMMGLLCGQLVGMIA